jgi:hypothetical protein
MFLVEEGNVWFLSIFTKKNLRKHHNISVYKTDMLQNLIHILKGADISVFRMQGTEIGATAN